MTTIKDIARLAGVSVTAVSYALNDTGTISEETRKRVLQAAKDLNYHPNAFARHLKKRKTNTIGVFITRFGGSFYEEILEGIHDAVLQTDYELMVCPESRTIPRLLTQRQVDGAIVFDSKTQSDMLLKLASKRFPIVVLDRYLEADYLLPLLLDNQRGTREAFAHLYGQGARRMGFVSGAADSLDNHERMRAFLQEAAQHDVPMQHYQGNFTERSGYEAAREMLTGGNLPEAVFCANDQMAIGLIKGLKEAQVRVPQDVGVVGFDDIQIARYMQPTLSTIGTSRTGWGATAAAELINYLEDGTPFPAPYRLPVQLIPRESSILDSNFSPPTP